MRTVDSERCRQPQYGMHPYKPMYVCMYEVYECTVAGWWACMVSPSVGGQVQVGGNDQR
jgi:hypothetical protein